MATQAEWLRRIDRFTELLAGRLYSPLADVPLEISRTFEEIPLERMDSLPFEAAPIGTSWGRKWEYAWFRGTLPDLQAAGGGPSMPLSEAALRPGTGTDSVVYVDGVPCGAIDRFHDTIDLGALALSTPSKSLRPGAEIAILTYAGHGDRNGHVGPVPPDTVTVAPVPGEQRIVGRTTVGRLHEARYQLLMDVRTLHEAYDSLPKETLRSEDLFDALCRFTMEVDLEKDGEALDESCRACRETLAPVFACRNGDTAPQLTAFGHSHLDVAWKWPLAETRRKMERTLTNQFALMARYPEYRYLQSQPYLMETVREGFPDLFSRFAAAVASGQVMPEGGMYVEADTNLTGGESLVRQFLFGKRFLREAFGVESRLLWLPDVFGYSAALPQILKGCGITAFSTSKILWAYNGGETFPYIDFDWEGIDGTRIPTHNHNEYNSHTSPGFLVRAFTERVQKTGVRGRLVCFGYGDGGGGATRDHLEYLRRLGDFEGIPRTRIAHPLTYFDGAFGSEGPVPALRQPRREVYRGELYLQCHRGTFTSQSRTKTANRRAEEALLATELRLAADILLNGRIPDRGLLDAAWKETLVAQFHDILPGSSIARVHEEAVASLEHAVAVCASVRLGRIDAFGKPAPGRWLVVNPLPQERTEWVRNPVTGKLAQVSVPAGGWTAVPEEETPGVVLVTVDRMENDLLALRIGVDGSVEEVIEKSSGHRFDGGSSGRLRLYRDTPSLFDAWDIDSMYEFEEEPMGGDVRVEVLESGGPVGRLLVVQRFGSSTIERTLVLRAGESRIETECRMDWQERHRLLKAEFCAEARAMEGVSEIQFGWLARPNDRSTQYEKDRFEVCQQRWSALRDTGGGMAVYNDCRQGVSFHGPVMRLTLQKGSMAPDMDADRGEQVFRYALRFWRGDMDAAALSREALAFNVPLEIVEGRTSDRPGELLRLHAAGGSGILVDAVKPAEDGSGDIVVRMHEARGTRSRAVLEFPTPVSKGLWIDMIESEGGVPAVLEDGGFPLDLPAFGIRTLRVTPGRVD